METQHPWIERHAKLFEAGEYPDKGISISPEDLSRLQSNFTSEVPILIEHATSPLEIGFLTSVRAEGSELFGTVQLSPEANALIEKSNAKALSVGLSVDLTAIEEVSLVREPRVASARIFSGQLSQEDWHAKFLALEQSQREESVNRQLRSWIEQGKLLPAQSEFAKALLLIPHRVTFGGNTVAVSEIVTQFVNASLPPVMFGELAPVGQPAPNLTEEEAAFYQRYFPAVELAEIASRK
jgi:hypothetical protein